MGWRAGMRSLSRGRVQGNELELGRLHDCQIGGLDALEDAAGAFPDD